MKEENKNTSDYTQGLENIVKSFLSLDSIPLKLAIESMSNAKVIDFDKKDTRHIQILEKISNLAERSSQIINKGNFPIDIKGRKHELGHSLSYSVFMSALMDINDRAIKFENLGKSKSKKEFLVYPHFCFSFDDIYTYVTLKTYDRNGLSSEQRSFYLTEVEADKIVKDALHFVIGFNISVNKSKIVYAYDWKVIDIGNVSANIKREFNIDNTKMYLEKNILAENSK